MVRFSLLLISLSLFTSGLFAQQTIESVPAGGAWDSPSTWVGGNVPAAGDNAVINGTVTIGLGFVVNDLTIHGTLMDNSASCTGASPRHLTVMGDIINNGSMLRQPQFYCSGIRIEAHGSIQNNGTWNPAFVYLAGQGNQQIGSGTDAYFQTESGMFNEKTGGSITASGPVNLKCQLHLNNAMPLNMDGHPLRLHGSGEVTHGELTNVSDIIFEANAQLGHNAIPVSIAGDEVRFFGKARFGVATNEIHGNLTVMDTLVDNNQSCTTQDTHLRIFGNITNEGVITTDPQFYCHGLKLDVKGNMTNNGEWKPDRVILSGSADQLMSCSPGAFYESNNGILNQKTGGEIVASSDLYLRTELRLSNVSPLNMNGNALHLYNDGRVTDGYLNGVDEIHFGENANLGRNGVPVFIHGDEVRLFGKARFGVGNNEIHGNVTVMDTLIDNNQSCTAEDTHLRIFGNITNEGVITTDPQFYCHGLRLELTGDIQNNGEWKPNRVQLTGSADQAITSGAGRYFETVNSILSQKTGGMVKAGSDLLLACPLELSSITDLDMQGFTLQMRGNGTVKEGNVTDAGHLLFEDGAVLGGPSLAPITISGDSIILAGKAALSMGVTFNGPVTVLDTMLNELSGTVNTLFNGNFTNLGVIQNFVTLYKRFSPRFTRNIENLGIWGVHTLSLVGNEPRHIRTGTLTYTAIRFTDTLNLIGSNSVPRLDRDPGFPDAYVIVHPDASLELTDRVAPPEMRSYGKVFWSHDINCGTTTDYNFYRAQLRNRQGCSVNRIMVETFDAQDTPGATGTISRYWRVSNTPATWADTLQRIILTYDDYTLGNHAPEELMAFYSDNAGLSWSRIEEGVTLNTVNSIVTILNAPAAGLYTLSSQTLGVSEIRPTLTAVEADRGGQGVTTVHLYGSQFTTDAVVTLRQGAATIATELMENDPFGEVITATFDLTDANTGLYDVEVELPGDTLMTLPGAFTVEPTTGARPFVHLSGREQVMLGRWQTYTITFGNTGNVDARAVPLFLAFSEVEGLEIEFVDFSVDITDYAIAQGHADALQAMSIHESVDVAFNDANGARFYPLYIPTIAANSVESIRFRVKSLEPMTIQVAIQKPMFVNPFDPACVLGVLAEGIVDISTAAIPGVGCVWSIGKNAFKTGSSYNQSGFRKLGSWIYDWSVTALDCGINLSGAGAFAKATGVFFGNFYGYYSSFNECRPDPVSQRDLTQFFSADPNEKVGPAGYTGQQYIAYPDEIPYVIYFENVDSATAPAQTVHIIDTLDMSVFDLASFRFGPVAFDTVYVNMTVGAATGFERYLDLRPSKDIILHIEGMIDTITGIVKWDFTSIDPMTGELTEDPFGGFLPPNVESPEGEGSVTFFIRLKDGLPHNTAIANEASIVFDVNEAIVTDLWANHLDLQAPESAVTDHTILSPESVEVFWGGSDSGSGIRDFTLHVSEDGGDYLSISFGSGETSTVFMGTVGSTYRFYTTATDSVGNVEMAPATPQLTVTLEPDGITEADMFGFRAYPNPVSDGFMTVEFSCNDCSLNMLAELMALDGRTVRTQHLQGQQVTQIDMGGIAPGTYLLRLRDGTRSAVRKVVVQ